MTHALLVESALTIRDRDTWFGRVEVVGKAGHDLHVHEAPASIFTVAKVQAGLARTVWTGKGVVTSIGGTASLSMVPPALAPRYSGRVAPGLGVFLTLTPSRHVM